MRDEQEIPYIVIERKRGGVLPFLWGGLIGAGAALLFAPRNGREVQRELRAGFARVRTRAEERIDEVRESIATTVEQAREDVHDRIHAARESLENRTQGVRAAADTARQETERSREDLQARVATAKRAYDLGQAAAAGEPGPMGARVEAEITMGKPEIERETPEERAD